MGKLEKKITRLKERIQFLEDELLESLTKKTSTTKEINVAEQTTLILKMKKDLASLTHR
jgi:hypothetical protein